MRRARRALLLVAVVPTLAACHSWRTAPAAPTLVVQAERPAVVRVTRTSGEVVTIRVPTVVADSIVGSTATGNVSTASSDVRLLEVRSFSATRTLALVVSHVAAVVSFVAIAIHLQPHYSGF